MRAVMRGDVAPPPMAVLMGITIVEVGEGAVVFGVVPGEQHYNPIGMVHGGLAATLIDSATGCAVHTTLPAGQGYTTIDLHVNFDRPITAGTGPVRCTGTVVNKGKRIATAEARLTSERTGKLLAHGSATCMLLG
jgi:uncharacterized protein (TIGR00369 family)